MGRGAAGWNDRVLPQEEAREIMDIRCASHIARHEGGDPGPRYQTSVAGEDFHRGAGL